jgi:GNAT superfamily N-acetyltransferase
MPDMLVKLYEIPDDWGFVTAQLQLGITIRKPLASEKYLVVEWVRREFGEVWAAETERSLSNQPISCFIAVRPAEQGHEMIGFACYASAAPDMFGPTGVLEACRGRGTGRALLLACLLEMKLKGFAYAIIGWVGPAEFYAKAAGAVIIPGSEPSIWKTWLYPR